MLHFSRPDSIQFLEISTQRLDISGISSVGFSLLPLSFSVRKGTDVRQQREFSASPKAPLFSRHHTFPAVAAGNKRGKSFCPLLTFFFFSPFFPCEEGRGYRCDDLPFPFLFLHKSLVSNSPDFPFRFFRFGKRKKIDISIFFLFLMTSDLSALLFVAPLFCMGEIEFFVLLPIKTATGTEIYFWAHTTFHVSIQQWEEPIFLCVGFFLDRLWSLGAHQKSRREITRPRTGGGRKRT